MAKEKTDIWMPIYIGDYQKDTQHLSAAEHGCYLLWLMHYWVRGPLPNSREKLLVISKLTGPDAWSIAEALLKEFFTLEVDGLWHQSRTDRERAKSASIKQAKSKGGASRAQALTDAQRTEIARSAAAARWGKQEPPQKTNDLDACRMPAESLQNACPSPSPSPSKVKIKTIPQAELEEVYQAYPRKVGKADALRAIERAARKLPEGRSTGWLLERTRLYAFTRRHEDPNFTPHPATWFNQGRYDDEALDKAAAQAGLPDPAANVVPIQPKSQYAIARDRQLEEMRQARLAAGVTY